MSSVNWTGCWAQKSPRGLLQYNLVPKVKSDTAQAGVFGFAFLEAFDLKGLEVAELLSPARYVPAVRRNRKRPRTDYRAKSPIIGFGSSRTKKG